MKVGKLYRFEGFGYKRSGLEGQLAVYLGEDFIHRDDGVIIENHRILKVGASSASIIDRGLLKHMAEVEA
tara:strand:- start:115 stop:324 length:210 start_codon:yes stop_codon:yes gene_type:complete